MTSIHEDRKVAPTFPDKENFETCDSMKNRGTRWSLWKITEFWFLTKDFVYNSHWISKRKISCQLVWPLLTLLLICIRFSNKTGNGSRGIHNIGSHAPAEPGVLHGLRAFHWFVSRDKKNPEMFHGTHCKFNGNIWQFPRANTASRDSPSFHPPLLVTALQGQSGITISLNAPAVRTISWKKQNSCRLQPLSRLRSTISAETPRCICCHILVPS